MNKGVTNKFVAGLLVGAAACVLWPVAVKMGLIKP